jgi:hypothetical protein
MNEGLLHYIWRYQHFGGSLSTTEGNVIEILFPGIYNSNAGPDFMEAKLRIGKTIWAGNVEMHLRASEWYLHNHHLDKAYDNIILHVVYENDKPVIDKQGNVVQTLEMKNIVDPELLSKYKYFIKNKNWIPCAKLIASVDEFHISSWLESITFERLQNRVEEIFRKLQLSKNNWEQVFYETLARNFGFNLFGDAFEMLAKALPISYIAKHKNNLFQIEALLFGQAGFLNDIFQDEYPKKLKAEYLYLQKKFSLATMKKHLWKFLRNRPNNFPTIRIAQFAFLLNKSSALFSKIIEAESIKELRLLFMIPCSTYWENHFTFDVLSPASLKKLGKASIDLLLINTIVPFIFAYGKQKNEEIFVDRAIRFLEQLPAEKNHIIKEFENYGIKADNAKQSQALLQLYKYYCVHKHCLRCSIGDQILKSIKGK